ncbi:MAG: hypothetical protein Q7R41_01250, partial [Phycisphaerales bacterium]|nr:hypothetical protein [Phycisphaerales bacterium]
MRADASLKRIMELKIGVGVLLVTALVGYVAVGAEPKDARLSKQDRGAAKVESKQDRLEWEWATRIGDAKELTRFRVVTSAGVLVIYDAAIPPGAVQNRERERPAKSDNPGFVAYWNDFETEYVYVFDRLLFTPDDAAAAIGSLERDFGFDPDLFASDDLDVSRISSIPPTTKGAARDYPPESPLGKGGGEGTIDDGSWQPASRELVLTIMGFGPEEDGLGGVAGGECPILAGLTSGPIPAPPPWASPDAVHHLALLSVGWCPPPPSGPKRCTDPCCTPDCTTCTPSDCDGDGIPNPDDPTPCEVPCCGDPCCGDPCCSNPCSCDPCCVDPCSCDPCCVDPCSCMNCDDGDACNGTETCSGGACVAGTPMNCNDGEPCTTDGCSAGTCTTEPKCPLGVLCCNGSCCQDSTYCSAPVAATCCNEACCLGECCNDQCCPQPGSCMSCGCCAGTCCNGQCCNGTCFDGTLCCDDSNPCTLDQAVCGDEPCTFKVCTFPPLCDDGDLCTEDICIPSACEPTTCENPACGRGDCETVYILPNDVVSVPITPPADTGQTFYLSISNSSIAKFRINEELTSSIQITGPPVSVDVHGLAVGEALLQVRAGSPSGESVQCKALKV